MKKIIILTSEHNGKRYRIEEDFPEVGAYLYVFEGGKCTRDYLQNSILDCKEIALEYFGVPVNNWIEIEE